MDANEARKILNLKPGENPAKHIAELQRAREEIAEMIKSSKDPKQAKEFKRGLTEFDEALEMLKQQATAPSRRGSMVFLWLLIVGLLVGGGLYWQFQGTKKEHITKLQSDIATSIQKGDWTAAKKYLTELETLAPSTPSLPKARLAISDGIAFEKTQFITQQTTLARDELQAGRFAEATAAAHHILSRFPDDSQAKTILETIDAAVATREKAAKLIASAMARDKGQYDPQLIDLLNQAKSLDPQNAEVAQLIQKVSSYPRTIRVPEDIPTPAEALTDARDYDIIVLAPGTWQGPLSVNVRVELKGADPATTFVQCGAEMGNAITIGSDVRDATISGITFKHDRPSNDAERFSTALIQGGTATFKNCQFTQSSGHGLAVVDGGQAEVSHCKFIENAWNGVAVTGKGSKLSMRDSESVRNQHHGVESWEGASISLINNRCEANARNGIHIDGQSENIAIETNQLFSNKEYGLVLTSAAAGKVEKNIAQANALGGFVIRAAAANVTVSENQAMKNQGTGLLIEKQFPATNCFDNKTSDNVGSQIVSEAIFTAAPQSAEQAPRAKAVEER